MNRLFSSAQLKAILRLSLVVLAGGGPALAAITMVQSHGVNTSNSTVTNAFVSNTVKGNLIIACVDFGNSTNFVGVTDSQANSFIQIASEVTSSGASIKARCYYAKNIVGGADTVTFTVSSTTTVDSYIHEVSGVDYYAPFDQSCTNTSTATSVSCNVTTTFATDIVFGFSYTAGTTSAGSGFTQDLNTNTNITEHKFVTTIGTYSVTATSTSSAGCTLIAGTFKAPLTFFTKRRDDP